MSELTRSFTSSAGFREPEHLVVRLKGGDENAFSEVFTLYKDLIFNLAFSTLADKSEAMDVTQEVFLTLHRKISHFRGDSSLKTWLYRVTLNQAASRNRWWKRRHRQRTLSLDLVTSRGIPLIDPVSENRLPDRDLFSSEVRRALERALEQVPFKQRTLVVLRDMHGLSYQEIAETTGLRVGTVKSRIARGRERLRELLAPYWRRGEE